MSNIGILVLLKLYVCYVQQHYVMANISILALVHIVLVVPMSNNRSCRE